MQPDLAQAAFMEVSAPRLPLDEWAEKKRIVAGGGARTGPWNPRYAVMAIEPMRAFTDDRVQVVVLVSPSQLMKTEFVINAALHTVYYGDDCLLWEPELTFGQQVMADRVRPSLKALGDVGVMTDQRKKRDSRTELKLGGGGTITMLTPNMKMGRSGHTARVAIIDELDRMGLRDMRIVAKERTTTYGRDAKILIASTPTFDEPGTVWRAWKEGSRGVWMGRCPHCNELASMDWDRVVFETEDDGFWLPETAALICETCGVAWSESDRLAAIHGGCYIHVVPDHSERTFRVPGPAHLWRSLLDIATEGAREYRATKEDHEWAGYMGSSPVGGKIVS